MTGVGYDLTAGFVAHVDPFKKKILNAYVADNARSSIVLEPNTYAIVISREHVFLSKRLAGTFHSKSSLAAQAVYLNSTTCDPNWKGRLIFSLYNASGNRVSLDLDSTFATMCVFDADRPSKLRPKESKAVIEKYLEGLEGNPKDIVGYVLKDDELSQEFESAVDISKRWASLPKTTIEVFLDIAAITRVAGRFWLAIFGVVICAGSLIFLEMPGIALSDVMKGILGFVSLIAGLATIWDVYRKYRPSTTVP